MSRKFCLCNGYSTRKLPARWLIVIKSDSEWCKGTTYVLFTTYFRHFTEDNHHGFLEDVSVQIIDRVFGDLRLREGFSSLS